jgi:hypothetical protein
MPALILRGAIVRGFIGSWVAIRSLPCYQKKITDSQKKASYVITLQFGHVLLRLSWVPVEGIKAIILPANVVYRIFPQDNSELQLVRGRIFKEDAQFHFMATILAEEGAYPSNLDLPPRAKTPLPE